MHRTLSDSRWFRIGPSGPFKTLGTIAVWTHNLSWRHPLSHHPTLQREHHFVMQGIPGYSGTLGNRVAHMAARWGHDSLTSHSCHAQIQTQRALYVEIPFCFSSNHSDEVHKADPKREFRVTRGLPRMSLNRSSRTPSARCVPKELSPHPYSPVRLSSLCFMPWVQEHRTCALSLRSLRTTTSNT